MNKETILPQRGETTANQADAAQKQYENDPSDPTRAWFTKVPTIPTGWEVKPGQKCVWL